MDVSELVAKLAKLQLEQQDIIEQLASIAAETQDESAIRVGDYVTLLTGGVRCHKGDRARVTKINKSSIHFTVLRNQHNTYKHYSNVQKIQQE
jgi:transcription antitermination factor NusG